jgi:hypothetical protein
MPKKISVFFLLLTAIAVNIATGQVLVPKDSLGIKDRLVDTISLSLQQVAVLDTITPQYVRLPDSAALALRADSLKNTLAYPIVDFNALIKDFISKSGTRAAYQQGELLPKGEVWVLLVILLLVVLFAVLKQSFAKQLAAIVQSFFSNRALINLNKEENLFTSWPFLLLFIQFGFTLGMFVYLVIGHQNDSNGNLGYQFFLTVSVAIILLYALKILILRFIGLVFNIQKPIGEYISILYLSYFNTSLLFIPLVIAFGLSPLQYGKYYMAIAVVLIAIIFVFQFIRAGINILSQYRFSKVYLFLYFCTLEIYQDNRFKRKLVKCRK